MTVGKVAANAVMAGCRPEYFPVVLAVAEAMLDPAFNLMGPSSSLGGAGILVIVNGPVVRQLDINCRTNLFGPGNRANATIGRAVRLILMNACAAVPGFQAVGRKRHQQSHRRHHEPQQGNIQGPSYESHPREDETRPGRE